MKTAILNSAMLDSDTAILDSDTLLSSLRFTQNTLTPLWLWLKLIQSDSTSFILIELDDGSHLEFYHLEFGQLRFSHLSISSQTHLHFPRLVPSFSIKYLHPLILTQLDDGSHLEFCHVGFRHCHLGFRHLVIFSQIHSKTLSLHSDLTQTNSIWLKLIHPYLIWRWQPAWILTSWIWPSWLQPS